MYLFDLVGKKLLRKYIYSINIYVNVLIFQLIMLF